MKLSKKLKRNITQKLITRINELYHDLEDSDYQIRHSGMFKTERKKWQKLSERYIRQEETLTFLDYGSGTGFVPIVVGEFLKDEDMIICTDLSEKILKTCEENINKKKFKFNKQFYKINGKDIPVESQTINIIAINSVLHHIYDLKGFASEAHRCLVPGGYLMVVHEPNAEKKLPVLLSIQMFFLKTIFQPKDTINFIIERIPVLEFLLRMILSKFSLDFRKRNRMLNQIAEQLINEGLTNYKLRGSEIQQLVDIHTEKGFSKEGILKEFHKFKLIEWTTYNYISSKSKCTEKINKRLQMKYPMNGKTLSFVLQKK